jgi:hypothetical protein
MSKFETLLPIDGPLFPVEYKQITKTLKGENISADCAEYFEICARYVGTDYFDNPVFRKNFWKGWKKMLPATLQKLKFEDFIPELEAEKANQNILKEAKAEAKKAMSKKDQEAEKVFKEGQKNRHGFVICDGVKTPITQYAVEAPSLLITRGKDPRIGCLKYRTQPKDITVNIVGNSVEINLRRQQFKQAGYNVVSDDNAMWVFSYKVKTSGGVGSGYELSKYSFFAATTKFAQENTESKYDHALDLLKVWGSIDSKIKDAVLCGDDTLKESALIVYLIKTFGIRVGNERDLSRQADTQGASTLKVKNIKFLD